MIGRVLMGCYEVPGWGGANTSAYSLFERMQQDGLDVHYLNIVDVQDAVFLRYLYGETCGNPKLLDDVHTLVLDESLFSAHPRLAETIEGLSPDVMVGDGYIAALLMKKAVPKRPLVFYTAGCNQVTSYLAGRRRWGTFSLDEFLQHARGGTRVFHAREKEASELADLIVTHAEMIRELCEVLFPYQRGKVLPGIMWRAELIAQDAAQYADLSVPFSGRDIDVIFVANSWLRAEKNYKLVRKIASKCRHLRVHVIGEVEKRLPGTTHHGLITRRQDLFALLGRAKAIVSPSLFDAAPGILWEGSAMGCNVIAAKNCGNWMLCNEQLLVHRYSANNFLDKISLSMAGKMEDNMDYFLRTDSYQEFLETLAVIKAP